MNGPDSSAEAEKRRLMLRQRHGGIATPGEINYRNIFKWLHDRQYEGVIGMEHGVKGKGIEGEKAMIAAYRWCDDF